MMSVVEMVTEVIHLEEIQAQLALKALDPLTPHDDMLAMVRIPKIARTYLVRNPSVPTHVMRTLFTSYRWTVEEKLVLLDHPNLDAASLKHLSKSANQRIKNGVAGHPNTPHDVLYQLWQKERNLHVRAMIRNPSTPLDLLIQFWGDIVRYVRQDSAIRQIALILSHPNVPYDGDWWNTTDDMLRVLP